MRSLGFKRQYFEGVPLESIIAPLGLTLMVSVVRTLRKSL